MPKRSISEKDLIKKYKNKTTLLHLAKTPIANDKCLIRSYPQLYALGFNVGGRPDGLWISRGAAWLEKARELENPQFPMCCYIYQIKIKPSANILNIKNESDFLRFDAEFPSYWINSDYFEIDFVDYVSGNKVHSRRRYNLDLNKLRKKSKESLKDILINNKIIFLSPEDAMTHCEFYRNVKIPIERFKYKDWAIIAEKYQGIIFNEWETNHAKTMNYLWFQSLDVASGCIWDVNSIDSMDLKYNKIDADKWESSN
jgi:hypothetical protein